jgi:hypothetical protein
VRGVGTKVRADLCCGHLKKRDKSEDSGVEKQNNIKMNLKGKKRGEGQELLSVCLRTETSDGLL